MQLSTVVATWQRVAQTTARSAKTEAIAALLVAAAPEEVGLLVKWLSGDLAQRQIGVGWAMLRDAPQPSAQPSLTVIDVDEAFTSIADDGGTGSQARRRAALASILTAATAEEQTFLRALLSGGLRQGALAGVMVEAVARAASVPSSEVRRAAMVSGDLAVVAAAALHEGVDALSGLQLTPLRPVHPMLAQTSPNVAEALRRLGGRAGLEWKVDGVRIQAHRRGSEIALFTRTLDDVTRRLPEIVRTVGLLAVSSIVIDGEVIALDDSGRPRPFQVTAARTGRRGGTDTSTSSGSGSGIPLHAYWFDVLHLDGTDLLTAPAAARRQALERVVGLANRVPHLETADPAAATAFLAAALEHGHEGIMAKSLTSTYEMGRRGAGWLKIKPVHTLDLVVIAVEWGSGRRTGKLSNIHLGARDEHRGGFVMLGKTFKGMTDEMLDWQTERFRELAVGPADGWVVTLRPEQVVEVAFDGVQASRRYPGGVTLRFARVVRYRDDKRAEDADTIEAVRAFHIG